MKKILLLSLLLISGISYAQEKDEKSNSKAVEFLSKDGTFMKREFYDLPQIGMGQYKLESQVLIMTDLTSGYKMGCLRLSTFSNLGGSLEEYIGTLDRDELDACIQCFELMQTDILTTKPEIYTETCYKTLDGVTIGCYYSNGIWTVFVRTKEYTTRSMTTISTKNVPKLIDNLKQAKAMIESKIE